MAPVAMIAPWPGISRGIEPTVPTVPGLVREIVRAFKIGDGQFVRARALHQVVISRQELREVHGLRVLDRRNFERPRAFLAFHVHRQAPGSRCSCVTRNDPSPVSEYA